MRRRFHCDAYQSSWRWRSSVQLAGIGSGDAGRRLHAAGRHAVDRDGRDDLRRLTGQTSTDPETTDADGNTIKPSSFNVGAHLHQHHRQYLAHAWRSASRRTSRDRLSSGGSYAFRLKYGFAQINLDDWMTRGSWIAVRAAADAVDRLRGGHLPLPLPGHDVLGARGLPRRRRTTACRSTTTSRPTTATSTSASTTARAITTRRAAPGVNNQKAFQIRGTVRPFATQAPVARGLRVTALLRRRQLRQERREEARRARAPPSSTST